MAEPSFGSVYDVPEWFKDGLCVQSPKKFEAAGRGGQRAICRECPVIEPCLERAIVLRIEEGILGGETAKARKEMRRLRKQGAT